MPGVWDKASEGASLSIAASRERFVHVLAGPGTGKTFAMMRKVALLLEERNNPARILVVTFTRTGAADLRVQLESMGLPTAGLVVASTLHSLCFRILGKEDVLKETNRNPRTLYEFEVDMLLRDLGSKFGTKREKEGLLRAYEAAWAREQYHKVSTEPASLDRRFMEALEDWLRFHKAMLVGELVPLTLRFLRDNPGSTERRSFDHILVDEYQDLNKADQAIIEELASKSTLTVVGDDNQSIYSFRFAYPEGILEFPKLHPWTRTETLRECRRCPKGIVEVANRFIDPQALRPDRALRADPASSQGEILLLTWGTPDDETEGVRKVIASCLKSKSPATPGDILVLVPRKPLGSRLRTELVENFIPAETVFPEDMLGSPEVCERLLLLQLLVDPDDRAALRCWLGLGSTTGRAGTYARLREQSLETSRSPVQLLEDFSSRRSRPPYMDELIARFACLKKELSRLRALTGKAFIDAWVPPGIEPLKQLRELVTGLIDPESPMEQMLQDIKSLITQPEVPSTSAYVRIMTLHKAKGLSAHTVFVLGLVEGLIPSMGRGSSAAEDAARLQEQRRLVYVAMTRAKDRLVLSDWTRAPLKDAMQMGATRLGWAGKKAVRVAPSRFLRDLKSPPLKSLTGQEFLETVAA